MPDALALSGLTREEIGRLAPDATIVLPLGATEQHGGHLPVAVDTILCERIATGAARLAAAEAGPFLVAPALPFGRSDHHLPFPGTLSLRSPTLLALLGDLLRSLAAWGARAVFAVNGHGGNDAALRIALADGAEALPLTVGGASYWTLAWNALVAAGAEACGAVPGHAGGFETSLMLAVAPELVREDGRVGPEPRPAAEDPAVRPVRVEHGARAAGPGTSDDARAADPELGRRLLDQAEREVARALVAFHRSVARGEER